MKRQRIIGFIIDFIIIAVSFEMSEYFAVQVFKSEKWFVELIVYMVVFMSLHGIVSLVKKGGTRRKMRKEQEESSYEKHKSMSEM